MEQDEDKLEEDSNVFDKFHIIPFQHTYNHVRKILKLREVEQNKLNDNDENNLPSINYLDELTRPPDSFDGLKLGDKIEKNWFKEIELNDKKRKRPSLFKVIFKTLAFDYIRGIIVNIIIKLICMILTFNSIRLILNTVDEITNLRSNFLTTTTTNSSYQEEKTFNSTDSNNNVKTIRIDTLFLDEDENDNNRIFQEKLNYLYRNLIIRIILLFLSMSFYTLTFSLIKLERIYRGVKCRTSLTQLILRKSFRLKFEISINESSSKAINLISNECTIIEEANNYILFIILGPLIVFGGTLWIGFSLTGLKPVFASYILMLISFLFQLYIPKLYKKIINGRLKETKNRIEVTGTFLNSIKVAKMYSWELVFRKIINQVRLNEMNWLKRLDKLYVYDIVSISLLMKFLPTIVYITYIYINGDISATVLFIGSMGFQFFVAEGLFNFARSIRCLIDMRQSCRKIEDYLLLKENNKFKNKLNLFIDNNNYKRKNLILEKSISIGGSKDINCDHVVISFSNHNDDNKMKSSLVIHERKRMSKRNLKYFISNKPFGNINKRCDDINKTSSEIEKSNISNIIDDLSIYMKQGELVVVVGQVGCGKSTLLLSLLGEIKPISGNIIVANNDLNVKLAYVSQEPWILSDTIKNNILLGRTFNPLKYQRVIEVCCLERDISLLPRGDETLVGSKGVSLSGGQKARVNLARAVYSDADIYLLDDPLSAVDSKVSFNLFNNCIKTFLKDKLVILATHQRQYLNQANKIICLERGSKPFVGTYRDFTINCHNYLNTTLSNSDDKNNEQQQQQQDAFSNVNQNIMTIDELYNNDNCDSNINCNDRKRREIVANLMNNNNNNNNNDLKSKLKSPYLFLIEIGFSKLSILIIILTMLIYSPLNAFVDYYLRLWREKIVFDKNDPNLDDEDFTKNLFLGCAIYFIIATINCFIFAIFNLKILDCLRNGSNNLHYKLMNSLFSAKMSFYDFCPAGNLGSRYAGDFTQIDHVLKPMLISCCQCLTWISGFCLMVLIIKPICAILFIITFLIIGPKALKNYKNLMKLTDLTKQLRAPIYTNISPIIDELDTIRSNLNYVNYVKEKFNLCQNEFTTMSLLTIIYETRLATLIKIPLLAIMGTTFYIMFVYDIDNLETAKTGVFFMLVNNIVFFFPLLIEMWSTTEASMASVISVQQLLDLEPEEEEEEANSRSNQLDFDNRMEEEQRRIRIWKEGRVEFKSVSLRYFEDEKPVLRDLSFIIEGGEKVGVVGRTGAGKSTIVSVLFRLYPFEGLIEIDGLNTKELKLSDLRSSLGVIPQDPVLFCDTLRKNLDPFNEYDDSKLWKALEVVELKQHVSKNLLNGLDYLISEGGRNFSVGQRQLVCLARAILKSPKVLVMDEATANVDQVTDILIQKTIKKHFINSTVITIAHRLNTILDYDKVLVLDAGRIVEFDKVNVLLAKENGLFKSMVSTINNNNNNKQN